MTAVASTARTDKKMMDRETERVRLKKEDEEREANERKRTVEESIHC